MMKPRLFVASSTEGLEVARRFAEVLSDVVEAVVWPDAPDFRPTSSTLDGLIESAEHYDFGLFIFTPDDKVTSRGQDTYSARDNVILEFGLFLGALGKARTFAVAADGDDPENKVKVIADLFGITLPRFVMNSPVALRKSIARAATQLRLQIEVAGRRELAVPLLRKWSFKHQKATFSATLGGGDLVSARSRLTRKRIGVVCRKGTKRVNFDEDRKLAISETRAPIFTGTDMEFKVTDSAVLGNLDNDDVVEAYVVLVPETVTLKPGMTLNDMRAVGCLIVDRGAKSESGSARRP